MNFIIIFIVVGAIIQSFMRYTHGYIHDLHEIVGGLYTTISLVLAVYSIFKFGWKNLLIILGVFILSNLISAIIFGMIFRRR